MPDNNLSCMLNIPYPKITESDLNKYDKQMILKLYASKLVSIHDYIYMSLVFAESSPELSDIFECISISEMKHFKLYAKLLYLSGVHPGYKALMPYMKNSFQNTVRTAPIPALEQLYNSERISASNTRLVLSQVNDPSAVKVLKRVVTDEDHHEKLLYELGKRYG